MFSSIASAPAKQSVSDTITVLSGRLSSATLLEDRRAAILGLRSFAKEYPASVASGALRSLIGSLSKDGEDVDTVKVVLETLLMLFNPNQDSPEASEEIALWLADEFTQRQENITLLLDFLETNDFYSRLYSLQLLSAILAARTDRTEECIVAAPLGVSRLVAVLDDRREAVRNEGLTLLTYLTPSSPIIQKIVAFQSAFEKDFAIIAAEGGLIAGDRIVEDCLILLANLLRLNPSNQSLFREEGHVPRLAKLLETTYHGEQEEVAQWAQAQRNRNVYALLAVLRFFLVSGSEGTPQNQAAFWQHGVLYHALQLAFSRSEDIPIRAEALNTCADIIRGNAKLQENFAQLQVPSVLETSPKADGQAGHADGVPTVYVIDGLLDLVLSVPSLQAFDLRLAACQCIKSYLFNHTEIRSHFLRRAIDGHNSGADETANVLTTLLQPLDSSASIDPYRHWFAAVITFHLLQDNPECKALAMAVTEGDAESGEEVVTSIQTVTAHLLSALLRDDDERILVGYLMLLIGWLFEDLDGVNDFLGEGSNINALAEAVVRHPPRSDLVRGLSSVLLGIIYEFSTKDSPITRTRVHSILMSKVGREKYVDTLSKLRSHDLMRNFEVTPQKLDNSGDLPEVFFDATFVDFFKDNYNRLLRAIDRDPGMEISVVTNGVQKGISREMVDSLRARLEEKEQELQKAIDEKTSLNAKLDHEQMERHKSQDTFAAEIARIKSVNEALQRHHEEDIKHIETRHRAKEEAHQRQLDIAKQEAAQAAETIHAEHRNKEAELQRQLDYVRKTAETDKERAQRRFEGERADLKATIARLETAEAEAARVQRRTEAEISDLNATISRLEVELMKALQEVRDKHASEISAAQSRATKAEEQAKELERKLTQRGEEWEKMRKQVTKKEEEKAATQTELDDLLMVFGDLEEKVEKYKKRLRDLNQTVTDDEDGDDEDGDDDDDDGVD
ncbi:hypothetical protein DL764_006838 [Monosporascus ibericus]|uniref:Vesicle tethering protein Uso1/P115-like head domain-containing protein n=1 Tax=Monosporascus ibericus TaxID=155417 RepID=A0A4Q4T6T2_9PEZI|nr:hypothetical protein DL764_006838 [Monosporascus ibericus]